MAQTNWLWLGFASMVVGSVVIFAMGWNRRTRDEENHYYLHLFVVLAATVSYYAMANGQGAVGLPDGRTFLYARYLDWAITTPLLLLGLTLTALQTPFRRWALVLGILFTDVFMIVTGLFAGLSPAGSSAKWVWYLISSGAFLFIYVGLWGPLRDESNRSGPAATGIYKTNAAILSVVWFFYPVVFLFGSEGLGAVDAVAATAAYTILDVIAKVVYGIFSLAETRRKTTRELDAGEVPAHDLRPAPVAFESVQGVGRTARAETAGTTTYTR